MKLKKDRGRFTVRFDMENPDHVRAVEYLERQRDRGKAQYLADAILCYEKADAKSFQQTDLSLIHIIIGIVIKTIVLTAIFGTYYALFIRQNSMVSPEQISISAYSLTDEQITFRLELLDGYCGGTIKTYTDENRNLYISVLRTVIKEELSDGETEIMNYGFNHEKKDYIAVYYGTPNNCELIWKKGDLLPTAPKDIFE